jgi:predicted Zn-dependent peptidase
VRAFNFFHPQRYSQEILAIILGGMMSSRLFIKIREEMGLAYYITTENEANPDSGFLVTQAGVDNSKVEKAILAILKEYQKIAQRKVSKKELKKAKENFKGHLALLLESSDALASFFGTQELLEKKILTPKEICDKIDKVKADDILWLAQKIFQPKNLNLAIIGPFSDSIKFQKLLKI